MIDLALDFTRGERGDGDWCLCWVYVSCLDCDICFGAVEYIPMDAKFSVDFLFG